MSLATRSRTACTLLRLPGVSAREVCSRQRLPWKKKSRYSIPVSGRALTLAMEHSPVGHRNGEARHGGQLHVALDYLPHIQNLPAAKRSDVMHPFQKDAVLHLFPDRARVIFDLRRQFFGG